eukprot:gene17062-5270_t
MELEWFITANRCSNCYPILNVVWDVSEECFLRCHEKS